MSTLLELDDVSVVFKRRRGASDIRAVDDVSLTVGAGEIVGLVGESGSGKSTLARLIVGINEAADGEMRFDGEPLLGARRPRQTRHRIQMVFQDPFSSLNPRMTVRQHLAELLRVHQIVPRDGVQDACEKLMEQVQLPASLLDHRPRSMSGGQRQRVAIARALALQPDLLIADEPVSALDVSVQAGIITLFAQLREQLGLAILFIAHDLAVVAHVCDRVAVMYMGQVVESGTVEAVFSEPRHPYTRGLMAAVPKIDATDQNVEISVSGDPPNITRLPNGCRFRTRCPQAVDRCAIDDPAAVVVGDVGGAPHIAACHFAAGPEGVLNGR